MLLIFYFILSILYYFLSLNIRKDYKNTFLLLFLIVGIVCKFSLKIENLPDFIVYYDLLDPDLFEATNFKLFFTEPYFFSVSYFLQFILDKKDTLEFFYFFNFIIANAFFVWLAYLKDIDAWKKYLLFTLYFPLFAFVLLRNTPAYILVSILFYSLNKNRYKKIAILSFLSHLSSIPALMASFFKNKKINLFALPIIIISIFLFNLLLSSENFILFNKFQSYQNNETYGQNIFHKIYFAGITILISYLLVFFKNHFLNYSFIFLILIYFLLQNVSSIMGFRYSIYIILYILLNTNLAYSWNVNKRLNIYSFTLIPLGLIGVYFYFLK